MKIQIGIRLSAAIAQNGIFARDLAAATYGGSGFGGGGGAGSAAALRGRRTGRRGSRGRGRRSAPAWRRRSAAGWPPPPAARRRPRARARRDDPGSASAGVPGSRSRAATIGGATNAEQVRRCPGHAAGTSLGRHRRLARIRHDAATRTGAYRHLCTTARSRDTDVPDCTASQTCGATTVRADVHERPGRPPPGRLRSTIEPFPTTAKGKPQADARHRHLGMARDERGVPRLVLRRHRLEPGRDPVRQAAPGRQAAVVGRGDDRLASTPSA